MQMPAPDYSYQASRAAKVLGSRLIRTALNKDTTLYGWVEFAQWSDASPNQNERYHWYEVRFQPLGTRFKDNWCAPPPCSDNSLNRLHFSVLERTAAHPAGVASLAKLGPVGHIRTEPKSIGLGTYLRDLLIVWVASLHPNASVAQGSLSPVDGGAANLKRRSRFYQGGNFQIRVNEDGSGAFWADRLDGLRKNTNPGKMVELTKDDMCRLLQCMPELEKAKQQTEELNQECNRLEGALAKAKVNIFLAKCGMVLVFVLLLIATYKNIVSWHLF